MFTENISFKIINFIDSYRFQVSFLGLSYNLYTHTHTFIWHFASIIAFSFLIDTRNYIFKKECWYSCIEQYKKNTLRKKVLYTLIWCLIVGFVLFYCFLLLSRVAYESLTKIHCFFLILSYTARLTSSYFIDSVYGLQPSKLSTFFSLNWGQKIDQDNWSCIFLILKPFFWFTSLYGRNHCLVETKSHSHIQMKLHIWENSSPESLCM